MAYFLIIVLSSLVSFRSLQDAQLGSKLLHFGLCLISFPALGALFSWLTDYLDLNPFTPKTLVFNTLCAFSGSVVLAKSAVRRLGSPHMFRIRNSNTDMTIMMIFFIPYCLWLISNVSSTDASAWDLFDWWGKIASEITRHHSHGEFWSSRYFYPFGPEHGYGYRHPPSLSFMLAWSVALTDLFGSSGSGLIVYVLFYIGIMAVYVGTYVSINPDMEGFFLALPFFILAPLAENHVGLGGYAELPMGSFLVAITAIAALTAHRHVRMPASFLLIFLVFISASKNSGFIFAAIWSASLCLFMIYEKSRSFLLIFLVPAILTILVIIFGLKISVGGIKLAVEPWLARIFVAGYELSSSGVTVDALLKVFVQSYILNASFSVFILFSVFSLIFIHPAPINRGYYLTLLLVFSLFFILHMFLLFDHGLNHGLPSSDTGHSRFSLVPFLLVPLLIPFILKQSKS